MKRKGFLKLSVASFLTIQFHIYYLQIHVRTCWESVSYVNLDSSFEEFKSGVTCAPNTTDPVTPAATEESTLPLFLQDQGTFGGTKELLEKFQVC